MTNLEIRAIIFKIIYGIKILNMLILRYKINDINTNNINIDNIKKLKFERNNNMKLLTINVHAWIEENQDEKMETLAKVIAEKDYDVIAMQEVNQ